MPRQFSKTLGKSRSSAKRLKKLPELTDLIELIHEISSPRPQTFKRKKKPKRKPLQPNSHSVSHLSWGTTSTTHSTPRSQWRPPDLQQLSGYLRLYEGAPSSPEGYLRKLRQKPTASFSVCTLPSASKSQINLKIPLI